MPKNYSFPRKTSSLIGLLCIVLSFLPTASRAQAVPDLDPAALIAGGQYAAVLRGFMDRHEVDGKDGPRTRSVMRKMGNKDLNSIENLTEFSRRAHLWHPGLRIEISSDLVTRKIETFVAGHLRDPNSLMLRDLHVRGEAICGYLNAKNSFGGYVGFTPFAIKTWAFSGVWRKSLLAALHEKWMRDDGYSEDEANSRARDELEASVQAMREEFSRETNQRLLFLGEVAGSSSASALEIGEAVYECYLRGYDGGLPDPVLDLSL